MPKTTTTIAITRDDWQRLNSRKEPGDDFADVVGRVLDRLEAAEADDSAGEEPAEAEVLSVPGDGDESIKRDMVYGEENSRDSVREAIREMDLPGAGEKLEARQEALVDLYEHLKMTGEADKSEFMKVLEAHDHGYASPESYWSNVVKGKDTLQSLSGVVPPAEGNVRWRYDGQ